MVHTHADFFGHVRMTIERVTYNDSVLVRNSLSRLVAVENRLKMRVGISLPFELQIAQFNWLRLAHKPPSQPHVAPLLTNNACSRAALGGNMPLSLKVTKAYPADEAIIHWRGVVIDDPAEFDVFLQGPVKARVTDAQFEADFASDLQALATTDMATAALESLLTAVVPPLDWEIGEAMAECLLSDEQGVCWPWNENRDRKTPKASLPGADLVGFLGDGDDTVFLFGEVKTSSHAANPPGVMNGRSGLAHQIDSLTTAKDVQFVLLKWLAARCGAGEMKSKFITAARRYVESGGTDFAVVGVLLRDTLPHLDDLRTRGESAAKQPEQPRIRLDAWYAPRNISQWVDLTMAEA